MADDVDVIVTEIQVKSCVLQLMSELYNRYPIQLCPIRDVYPNYTLAPLLMYDTISGRTNGDTGYLYVIHFGCDL